MCPRPDARVGGGARPQVDQRESPGNTGDSGLWDSWRGTESKELGSAGTWPSHGLERALGVGGFDFSSRSRKDPGNVTSGLRNADLYVCGWGLAVFWGRKAAASSPRSLSLGHLLSPAALSLPKPICKQEPKHCLVPATHQCCASAAAEGCGAALLQCARGLGRTEDPGCWG